ncbi:MAG: hypothetical protein WAK28_09155, partial [Trebonia sp.]
MGAGARPILEMYFSLAAAAIARTAATSPGPARRIIERPAAVLAARREWMLAERYIEPGLVFCRERGLESS